MQKEPYAPTLNFIDTLPSTLDTLPDFRARKVIGFVFLWMTYNSEYNLHNDDKAKYDDAKFKNYFLKIGCSYCDTNRTKIYDDLLNTQAGERRVIKNIYNPKKDVCVPDSDTAMTCAKVAEAIYTIRCNYLHGDKEMLRDEEQLIVCWAYDVLRGVVSQP